MNDHILNHPLVMNSIGILGVVLAVVLVPAFIAFELMPVLGRPIAYLVGRMFPGIGDRRFSVAFRISYVLVVAVGLLMASAGSRVGAERAAAEARVRHGAAVVDASQAP
jgi:hypothetical protein